MSARVTMRDVAREAGVSPMTVSRALKGDGTVSERTQQQVRDIADRLGYVYDSTAQAFRAQRSGFVAVLLPSINNANFAATHRALTKALADTGLQILLGITDYSINQEERLVRQLLTRRPEAIVLTGGTHTPETRTLLRALNIPVLEMWDRPAEPLGHVVGFSNAEAMGLVVRHLAAQGRTKLAFLGAQGDSDRRGAERRRGAMAEAQALRLPEITLLRAGPAPVTMTDGARTVVEFGSGIAEFDALLCVSDPVAFGAINACKALDIEVPTDLAVTGFGAFEIASVSTPNITTVDVNAAEIGHTTGQLIADLLGGRLDAVRPSIVEPTPVLIHGGSS